MKRDFALAVYRPFPVHIYSLKDNLTLLCLKLWGAARKLQFLRQRLKCIHWLVTEFRHNMGPVRPSVGASTILQQEVIGSFMHIYSFNGKKRV